MGSTAGLMEFLDSSLTSYHAVKNIKDRLLREGFTELSEKETWTLEKGGRYFVMRNDSALMAFCLPNSIYSDKINGYHIYAAHSDSPAFKLKEFPEIEKDGTYVSVNIERYGGAILSTWFDRPLTIAGRVCVEDAENRTVAAYPVQLGDNLCIIPSLAVHLNRESGSSANNSTSLSVQNEMLPIIGMAGDNIGKGSINRMLAKALSGSTGRNYCEDDILSYDLFVENNEKSVLAGMADEFIIAPRYDDLACVYAGVVSIINASPRNYIDVFAVFDNEEVGSCTRQGADSTFLRDTLENIADGLGVSANICRTWRADSFLVSADNAHACHPNYAGKSDLSNKPYLNKGIVLKYHGSQKYATDAYSAAYVKRICRQNDIPVQTYANNSDIAGGSTLGNLVMAQASMAAADIGLPQLAMHSAYETAGVKDIEYMIRFASAFFGL